jgi:hypothetical protein
MLKQNLLKTKPKVNVASTFVGVIKTDKQGRPSNLVVPGSQGKQYHVILRRFDKAVITCECRLDVGFGHFDCQGNSNHNHPALCYHSRASVDFALRQQNLEGAWCADYQSALTLNNLKQGVIYTVKSHQSGATVYLVVSKKAQMRLL